MGRSNPADLRFPDAVREARFRVKGALAWGPTAKKVLDNAKLGGIMH